MVYFNSFYLSERQLYISFSTERLNPNQRNFAMTNSHEKQLNAFENSDSSSPDSTFLTDSKQFCELKPLLNPLWYFDSNKSIKFAIYLLIIFSKIFEIFGKILTG